MLYKRTDELQCHIRQKNVYSHPQYNPPTDLLNVLSYYCIIKHFSNPQYNPTSLCIKEMQKLLTTDKSDQTKVAQDQRCCPYICLCVRFVLVRLFVTMFHHWLNGCSIRVYQYINIRTAVSLYWTDRLIHYLL